MDGEHNGKPENPIKMDDLGGKNPYFWKHLYKVIFLIKGSLDEKLPSYEVLKMLKE